VSSAVPAEIAGIGSSATKLRVAPGFDPLKAKVGPDEYFVLSRIDGVMTLRDVLLATGLPIDRGIAIVLKLRSLGAVLLPGEKEPPANLPPPPKGLTPALGIAVQTPRRTPTNLEPPLQLRAVSDPGTTRGLPAGLRPPANNRTPPAPDLAALDSATVRRAPTADIHIVLPNPTAEERAALAEPGAIGPDERLRILALARLLDAHDPWALLGVPHGADARVLKHAYFKLSKEIHPDRFYGRQLGSFADRLTQVFEAVSRAYAKLTTPERSSKRMSTAQAAVNSEQPQTPQEYAIELFDRACGLEVGGDALGAMKLFAAAVRIDPQTRYLRRAASCALAANQPKTAVEYAKKAQTQAPNDASSARLLAAAFKAAGKLADAEEVLVMAMAIKSENDVLTAELRNDLADVRRLIAQG
jgi:hypothetical protein